MQNRLQVVAILGALALLVIVLELVRRRRLMERYALLWLFSAVVILGLSLWTEALNVIARWMGIISAPNALFFVAVAFILLLLLHFSAAMSRLSDQTKVLAQRYALLEERVRQLTPEEERDDLYPQAGSERRRSTPGDYAERARRFGS
jgi:hypothetical protein